MAILLASAGLQAQQLEGTLNIVWGDPHPTLGSSSDTVYTLESLTGPVAGQNRVRLQMAGQENVSGYHQWVLQENILEPILLDGRCRRSGRCWRFGRMADASAPEELLRELRLE